MRNISQDNLAINTIIKLIWEHKSMTRAELSRASGFSRSTITINVNRLLASGILVEESKGNQNENRKLKHLFIARDLGYILGIELGASSCELGICDISANLLAMETILLDYSTGPDSTLKKIISSIDCLITKSAPVTRKILGIGVGLPSPVDFEAGYAVYPAFMPGWHQYPIGRLLADKYMCNVFVDNEVNTMALGESYLSQDFSDNNLLFIKLGTGIGAGMIIHGNIYRGNSGLSGNIGHILIEGRKESCKCGKTGCLEAIAGGAALAQRANKAALGDTPTILSDMLHSKGNLTAKDLREAMEKGDRVALDIIKDAALVIGSTVGKLVVFFDPKSVIIGGGLTGLGPQFIDYIRKEILLQSTPWVRSDFQVEISRHGNQIGVIGSAMLCIKELIMTGSICSLLPYNGVC